jgi:hypothetical protein
MGHRIARSVVPFVALAIAVPLAAQQTIPTKLSDQEFWKLVSEVSEAGGYFRSENFVGNEVSLQHAVPELQQRVKPGGVYLGVAPDQNFTLMVALRPRIAFIVDIRRQNLIQHLLYKAIIEMSPTRADFLARLFSRQKPDLDPNARLDSLMFAVQSLPPSRSLFIQNYAAIKEHLMRKHGFALSTQDTLTLHHVYDAFFSAGPDITYNYPSGGGGAGRGMPTYASMVSERDATGAHRSYLANERNYGTLREMQLNNLIVPIVGDFAGPRALRSVGQWVRDRGATITAFYTSNVEQYLFQAAEDWARFYNNMATLPLDSTSTLIRSVPNNNAGIAAGTGWVGPRSTMLLSYMREIVTAFRAGRVTSYPDVIAISR